MKKFLTVVYEINDADASKAYRDAICDSISEEADIPGCGMTVVGISTEDEMSRVEYLETLLDGEGISYDQSASRFK